MEWDEGPDTRGNFGPYKQSERRQYHYNKFAKSLIEVKKKAINFNCRTKMHTIVSVRQIDFVN